MGRRAGAEIATGYHIGDARQLREHLPQESVDVVITSPPYWDLKDYGSPNQIGFGQAYKQYIRDLTTVFSQCKEVLRSSGSLWIIIDTFKKNGNVALLPFDLAREMQEDGWFLQDIVVWQKDKTLPWSHKGKMRSIFEYILFFSKSQEFKYDLQRIKTSADLKKWWVHYPERYSPQGKAPDRIWRIPLIVQGWGTGWVRHFCPFPQELVERILLLTSDEGDVVFDPFAGSGMVLAQAKAMGRREVGLDLNPKYKKMYEETVLAEVQKTWLQKKRHLEDIEDKRKNYASTIMKLRKLKYPIELLRRAAKNDPELQAELAAIMVIGRDMISDYKAEVLFVGSNGKRDESFLRRMQELSTKHDLKKFELDVSLEWVTQEEAQKRAEKLSHLFLYKNGRTNKLSSTLSGKEIAKHTESPTESGVFRFRGRGKQRHYPRIISNLRVEQDVPK